MMQRYAEYKDSGVDWLGEIPTEWQLIRIGSSFRERREKVSDVDFEPLSVTKYGIVPRLENAAKTNDGDNRKLVRNGDFVINSRSDRKGSSGIAKQDGSVSLINIVMEPKGVDPEFCNHLLKSYAFVEEFYRMGHGIVADLWTTRYSEMKAVLLALPTLREQTAIANFLDKKTEKIDEAVGIKRRQIELLKERKQILIQNAVTKGLNPNAPMKDSGIDWIGDIPSHWEVKPGLVALSENKRNNKGMKRNKVLSLSYGKIIVKPKEKLVGLVPESFETYQLIDEGDIVIRGTDLQNDKKSLRTGLAKNDGIITSAYLSLRVSEEFISRFMHFYLHSLDISKILYRLGSGLRQNLSFSDFKRLPVLKLPKEEQAEIVKFIDNQEHKIDVAIKIKQNQITKLNEYKVTLINAAVTGKIKVTS